MLMTARHRGAARGPTAISSAHRAAHPDLVTVQTLSLAFPRKEVPMHAVVIAESGGPEVLQWTEVPDPVPGPGEVLVDVAASAVNRADMMQRQGFYDPPKGASPYPGLECSGTIAEVGEGVTGWHPGDAVCALLSGGGYAEKVAVPAGQLLPAPKSTTLIEAAALPETVCT